ncbi:hypothetical protein VPH35_007079 [Triticum aestivum]
MDSTEDRPSLVAEEKDKEPVPFSDAPPPVRAVLNRPWPSPIVILPEEIAALEGKEGDDAGTRFYKAAARADVVMRNYIHEHGSLYMDENSKYMIDNSAQVEEIRCKHVTAEEMEAKIIKQKITRKQTYLQELALASFNKRKKVKFELCETLLSRLFYESSCIFTHLNFVAKRKDKKKLFFAEIEDCGQGREEILKVSPPNLQNITTVFIPYSPVCCYIFWH